MVTFVKSAIKKQDFPLGYKEIVFVGRSNVGKSTLINALYKKGLAFTGKTPGKTRLINFFNNDDKYLIVDVPGYGYANRSQDEAIQYGEMMEDYFSRDNIKLVIMIVDSRIGLTKDDEDMMQFLIDNHLKFIILANKIDKLSNNQLNNNKRMFFKDYLNVYYVSGEKRLGLDEVKDEINRSL